MFRLCFCVSVRMNLISHTWFLHIMYWFLSSSRTRFVLFLCLSYSVALFFSSFRSFVLCCLIFLLSAIKCRVSLCKYGFSKNSLAFNWYLSDEWILKDWLLRVVFLPLCQLSATKTILLARSFNGSFAENLFYWSTKKTQTFFFQRKHEKTEWKCLSSKISITKTTTTRNVYTIY